MNLEQTAAKHLFTEKSGQQNFAIFVTMLSSDSLGFKELLFKLLWTLLHNDNVRKLVAMANILAKYKVKCSCQERGRRSTDTCLSVINIIEIGCDLR